MRLFEAAGLRVEMVARAPASLGYFQLIVGSRAAARARDARLPPRDADAASYLEAWRSLTIAWSSASGRARPSHSALVKPPVCCAPMPPMPGCALPPAPSIGRISTCSATARWLTRNLEPTTILLAVRPFVQSRLETRLRERGHRVVRWDDVIER